MKIGVSTRRVEFEGCANFRDLGGYALGPAGRLRWGQLYRSDTIHGMTAGDARRARADLGIRTIIDLRTEAEVRVHGIGLLALPPVRYYHVSLLRWKGAAECWHGWRGSTQLSDCYSVLLAEAGPAIVRIIGILSRPDAWPAVFHCMAGKDRTGVVAAVILSILGADDEDIVADYALSEEYLGREPLGGSHRGPGLVPSKHQLPAALLTASPETMRCFLTAVRETHGSLLQFVRKHGVTARDVGRLRAGLVSPACRPEELIRI